MYLGFMGKVNVITADAYNASAWKEKVGLW